MLRQTLASQSAGRLSVTGSTTSAETEELCTDVPRAQTDRDCNAKHTTVLEERSLRSIRKLDARAALASGLNDQDAAECEDDIHFR